MGSYINMGFARNMTIQTVLVNNLNHHAEFNNYVNTLNNQSISAVLQEAEFCVGAQRLFDKLEKQNEMIFDGLLKMVLDISGVNLKNGFKSGSLAK